MSTFNLGNYPVQEYADAMKEAGQCLETLFGCWGYPKKVLEVSLSQKQTSAVEAQILDIADIERIIEEENEYQRKAIKAIRISQLATDDDVMITDAPNLDCLSFEEKLELLRRLGIDINDDSGLFSKFVAWHKISKARRQKLDSRLKKHSAAIDSLCKTLLQLLGPSMCFSFKELDGRVAMQPRTKYYYRGENAIYPSTQASIWRVQEDERLVWFMRLDACCRNLDRVKAIYQPKLGHTNYWALAQHYGLKTPVLDVTSDLMTAMFFACCEYITGEGWKPLQPKSYAEPHSRTHAVDSRYALLFRARTELNDLKFAICDNTTPNYNMIFPVSYQAVARCATQSAYMIITDPDYNLQHDTQFEVYRVKLSNDLCEWVYEQKNRGDDIYPDEGVSDIGNIVKPYGQLNSFSENTVLNVIPEWKALTAEERKHFQRSHGIRIIDSEPNIVDAAMIEKINREYSSNDAFNRIIYDLFADALNRLNGPGLRFVTR